jgi:hypothetical protein
MTVAELIAELQKMPQDAHVTMFVDPNRGFGDIHWVEKRYSDTVYLCDKYFTPYAEEDEE